VLVAEDLWRLHGNRAAGNRGVVGEARIVHPQRVVLHTVAVPVHVRGDRRLGRERRGEHQADFSLLHEIAGAVTHPRFRAAVRHQRIAEGGAIKVTRLLGIPHVELDVVGAVDGEGVLRDPGVREGQRGHA